MPPANAPHENEVHIPPTAPMGPLVGIMIIFFLLFMGAFVLWSGQIQRKKSSVIPYIPGDSTSTVQD